MAHITHGKQPRTKRKNYREMRWAGTQDGYPLQDGKGQQLPGTEGMVIMFRQPGPRVGEEVLIYLDDGELMPLLRCLARQLPKRGVSLEKMVEEVTAWSQD